MSQKRIWIFIIGLIVVVAIVGLWLSKGREKEPDVYKIGAILPLTGNLAFIGEIEKKGIDLAVEEINGDGGINGKKLKVIYGDSKGEPKEAVTLAHKFIAQGIKVFISSPTHVSLSIQDVIYKSGGLHLVYSFHPTITENNDLTFRIFVDVKEEAEALLSYIQTIKPTSIWILHQRTPEAESEMQNYLLPGLNKLGIKNVNVEVYEVGQKDFKGAIAKIKASTPDLLIIQGFADHFPNIFKSIAEYDLLGRIQILGNMDFLDAGGLVEKNLLEGVVFVGPQFDISPPASAKDFINQYRAKYKAEPRYTSAYTYDGIHMLARAMSEAGYEPKKIASHLRKMTNYQGVTGSIKVLPDGDIETPLLIAAFRDGKPVLLNLNMEK